MGEYVCVQVCVRTYVGVCGWVCLCGCVGVGVYMCVYVGGCVCTFVKTQWFCSISVNLYAVITFESRATDLVSQIV